MSQKYTPEEVTQFACDPRISVIVEACAGSGKTWLLVSRIIRLLLDGVKPHEILAITFTRKAAQEMKSRLEAFLLELQSLEDKALIKALNERGMSAIEAQKKLSRARNLFEDVLAQPQKISIDTFHGWFSRLCQAAPIGMGAPQGASLREDGKRLLDESLASWWSDLGSGEGLFESLKKDYECLLNHLPSKTIEQILTGGSGIVQQRAAWKLYVKHCEQQGKTTLDILKEKLPLAQTRNPLELALARNLDWNELKLAAQKMSHGSKTDQKHAQNILLGIQLFESGKLLPEIIQVIKSAFLTAENNPLKAINKCTDDLTKHLERAGEQEWCEKIPQIRQAWVDSLLEYFEWQQQQNLFEINQAWMRLGESMCTHYEEYKQMMRVQDFADIEWQTAALMMEETSAAYLQARLDAKYKHILIDEFQDTNPLQWQILKSWLLGYEADATPPKLFIVGDPKQSIYRFRRADSRLFNLIKKEISDKFGAKVLSHDTTRRNAHGIVYSVNQTFLPLVGNHIEIATLPSEGSVPEQNIQYEFREQKTLWKGVHGHPEQGDAYLLDLIQYEVSPEEYDNRHALEQAIPERKSVTGSNQRYREAQRIALLIKDWMQTKQVIDEYLGQKILRAPRYDDFLILVKRKKFLAEIERAFRELAIPLDSPRQGGLLQTLEADDLSSLLEVILTPANNLALAKVLRSPIFRFNEAQMQYLAQASNGQTWWQALEQSSHDSLKHAFELLSAWKLLSSSLPVHDLLDHIYSQGQIRLKYAQASLPLERDRVLANLDQFLKLALDVDGGRYPALSRFISELRTLKRGYQEESPDEGEVIDAPEDSSDDLNESDQSTNSVRLMTIHSAKGLEAPFVMILDANDESSRKDHSGLVLDWNPENNAPSFVCAYTTKLATAGVQEALNKENLIQIRESWNLLYVAMTRAKQTLIISGVENKPSTNNPDGISKKSWYGHLSQIGLKLIESVQLGTVQQSVQTVEFRGVDVNKSQDNDFEFSDYGQGIWRSRDPAILEVRTQSHSEDKQTQYLLDLGSVFHWYMEQFTPCTGGLHNPSRGLPSVSTIMKHLNVSESIVSSAVVLMKKILHQEKLQKYFEPSFYLEAWNELELIDEFGRLFRVDRLVEFEDHLMILDYKLSIPEKGDAVLQSYESQLNNYQRLISALRDDKPIKACLVDPQGLVLEV